MHSELSLAKKKKSTSIAIVGRGAVLLLEIRRINTKQE